MTYTGAMVLPQNAVVLQDEEMRYLDGGALHLGKKKWNKVSNVAIGLDVAFTLAGYGASSCAARKAIKLLKSSTKLTRTIRNKLISYVGKAAAGYMSTGINIALTIAGTSAGGLLAEGMDRVDKKNDGYIFA